MKTIIEISAYLELGFVIQHPDHQSGLEINIATAASQGATQALPTRAAIAPTHRADFGFVGRGNIRFIVDVGVIRSTTARSYVKEYRTDSYQNERQRDARYEPYLHPITRG